MRIELTTYALRISPDELLMETSGITIELETVRL